MKKILICVLALLLSVACTGQATDKAEKFIGFPQEKKELDQIAVSYGYQKPRMYFRSALFTCQTEKDDGELSFEFTDEDIPYFVMNCELLFSQDNEVISDGDFEMIAELIATATDKPFTVTDIIDFLSGKDGLIPEYDIYENYDVFSIKKGSMIKAENVFVLSIYHNNESSSDNKISQGYLEIYSQLNIDFSKFYNYVDRLESIFKKYKNTAYSVERSELFLLEVSRIDVYTISLQYNVDNSFNKEGFNKGYFLQYYTYSESENDSLIGLDVDFFVAVSNYLSNGALSLDMLNDFITDDTGKYEGYYEESEDLLHTKIYSPRREKWALTYKMEIDLREVLGFYYYQD